MVRRCKKKVDTGLKTYFPKYFGEDIIALDHLRMQAEMKIRKELGEPVDELLAQISEFFLDRNKPHVFNPADENCVIIEADTSFENVIASMEENGVSNAKSLTCFEFYAKIQYFEKKSEALKAKT